MAPALAFVHIVDVESYVSALKAETPAASKDFMKYLKGHALLVNEAT